MYKSSKLVAVIFVGMQTVCPSGWSADPLIGFHCFAGGYVHQKDYENWLLSDFAGDQMRADFFYQLIVDCLGSDRKTKQKTKSSQVKKCSNQEEYALELGLLPGIERDFFVDSIFAENEQEIAAMVRVQEAQKQQVLYGPITERDALLKAAKVVEEKQKAARKERAKKAAALRATQNRLPVGALSSHIFTDKSVVKGSGYTSLNENQMSTVLEEGVQQKNDHLQKPWDF